MAGNTVKYLSRFEKAINKLARFFAGQTNRFGIAANHQYSTETKKGEVLPDGVYIDMDEDSYREIENGDERPDAIEITANVYSMIKGKRKDIYKNLYMYTNKNNYEKRNKLPDDSYKLTPTTMKFKMGIVRAFIIDQSPSLDAKIMLHAGSVVANWAGCWGICEMRPALLDDKMGGKYLQFNIENMINVLNEIYNVSENNNLPLPVYLRPHQ